MKNPSMSPKKATKKKKKGRETFFLGADPKKQKVTKTPLSKADCWWIIHDHVFSLVVCVENGVVKKTQNG